MAQLVARFHGMEEVGGSNPPSSTEGLQCTRIGVFRCTARALHPCAPALPRPRSASPSWAEYNVLVSPCETGGKGTAGANVGMVRNASKGPVGVFEVSQTGWQDLNVLSSEC